MPLTWSWEEMDYVGEEEPAMYPIDVCAEACDVCGLPNTSDNRVVYLCYACGNATHADCGSDTEPSGGYDRDPDENYWLCQVCLRDCEPMNENTTNEGTLTHAVPLKPFGVSDDFDPFEEVYELP